MFESVKKKIDITRRTLALVGKKAQTDAASSAVNDTAFYARLKTIEFMKKTFDKPVARTLSSTIIRPLATAQKPQAEIFINDDADKGNRPKNWLMAEVYGSQRTNKRMEMGLIAAGIMKPDQHARGVKGAINDAGNLPGGQVKQMLSALQAGNDATQDSKDAKKIATWRIARRSKDGEPFGVFKMDGVHQKLFLVFTKKQKYKGRYPFHKIIKEAWDKKIGENYSRRFFEIVQRTVKPI